MIIVVVMVILQAPGTDAGHVHIADLLAVFPLSSGQREIAGSDAFASFSKASSKGRHCQRRKRTNCLMSPIPPQHSKYQNNHKRPSVR
ncbi:unnamed protein product [Nippostrongylus brasiliensis]|uniref:Secreted protein n=1 Tax=Nippostrongylus brasiliensis TaxID=27835 RepID=A0A0N4Y5R7_NIPBR|nr:unnamed protein product [Nippostrongylus brasiliensis]